MNKQATKKLKPLHWLLLGIGAFIFIGIIVAIIILATRGGDNTEHETANDNTPQTTGSNQNQDPQQNDSKTNNATNNNGATASPTISYHDNGKIKTQEWRNDEGQLHRDGDLPAWIRYYENGQVSGEEWYQNNYYIKEKER